MGNLLVADMKRCIKETFVDAITSMELQLTGKNGIEAAEASYTDAKAELRTIFKSIQQSLNQLDEIEKEEFKELARETIEKASGVSEKFSKFVSSYCRLVYAYIK